MTRKNIFELINEKYNIQEETKKIENEFSNTEYFNSGNNYFSLKKLINRFLFTKWKYRGTCLTIEEYEDKAEAQINTSKMFYNEEKNIINIGYKSCSVFLAKKDPELTVPLIIENNNLSSFVKSLR